MEYITPWNNLHISVIMMMFHYMVLHILSSMALLQSWQWICGKTIVLAGHQATQIFSWNSIVLYFYLFFFFFNQLKHLSRFLQNEGDVYLHLTLWSLLMTDEQLCVSKHKSEGWGVCKCQTPVEQWGRKWSNLGVCCEWVHDWHYGLWQILS